MKRVICVWTWFILAIPAWAGTIPNQITYQGTIKEQGVPVNASRTMLFRLTNADGSAEYWSSGNINVVVTQGLFSTILSPTGVDWQNVTPYIELSVGPQGQTPTVLSPREPITATAYSFISSTVVDGSVTTAKLADASVAAAKLDPSAINLLNPPGTIVAYGGGFAPSGWLLCDGKAYSRSIFANLFTAIGTKWGPGDGVATFNIPDMQGRVPVGAGRGAGLSNRNLADRFGNETHVLTIAEMPAHKHVLSDPGHSHQFGSNAINQGSGSGASGAPLFFPRDSGTSLTNITLQPAGGDALGNTVPHDIMQPSAVVNYIIKT